MNLTYENNITYTTIILTNELAMPFKSVIRVPDARMNQWIWLAYRRHKKCKFWNTNAKERRLSGSSGKRLDLLAEMTLTASILRI